MRLLLVRLMIVLGIVAVAGCVSKSTFQQQVDENVTTCWHIADLGRKV